MKKINTLFVILFAAMAFCVCGNSSQEAQVKKPDSIQQKEQKNKTSDLFEVKDGVLIRYKGSYQTERKIILPEILPSVLTGFGLAFGRCLGEYGSVVFIAGNKPFETEITPLIIMSELQEYDYKSATAIALVMLAASFLILFLVNMVQHRNAKILKGGR